MSEWLFQLLLTGVDAGLSLKMQISICNGKQHEIWSDPMMMKCKVSLTTLSPRSMGSMMSNPLGT